LIPVAIKDGGITLQYRPTRQISTGRFTRIDCSLQMYCEGLGIIKEAEVISVAEISGQINAINQFVLSKLCSLIAELLENKIEFETVSVKISPIQLLQERFVSDLAEMIKNAGIPANHLALEVDENTANSTFSRVYMCVTELSDMGIEIILSDFGSGSLGIYSILSMSVDVVKVKRQLIWQMDNTPNGASLVEGLVHLAKSFELKLVAEGVETEEQVRLLDSFGCDYRQGFYYSGVMPSAELIGLLKAEV